MNAIAEARAADRRLLSGNEAVAQGVWEAGARVATAYPGTPSTEILETLSRYPDIHAQWSVNEKVALEVAIGASVAGSRAFCAMKHVGLNVASDPLMSQTLAGVGGGLVLAVADDVGLSSSQNEQDSRYWGRFAHLPLLEPADSQEARDMTKRAFDLSERFDCPVILRLTTRICHVKTPVAVGARQERANGGFRRDPRRWVMVPANARARLADQSERDAALAAYSEGSDLNVAEEGTDGRIGFVTSGPAYMHVREAFPEAPVFKLGLSHPLPVGRIRAFAEPLDAVVVVEETEPLVEQELRAAGLSVHGKDLLPRTGEITPTALRAAAGNLLGTPAPARPAAATEAAAVFPRPPTMCVGCPHLGVFYCLSRIAKRAIIAGDIGCYTLGAGHPWSALDTTTCMGASMGMALGMDLGRADADADKAVIAVIGDSTFLHMGIQGLLDLVYNGGNVTVMILDNSATGMTGGQDHAGTGRDIRGEPAPSVDFAGLVAALGVKPERIKVVAPSVLPKLYKTIRDETKVPELSVIITNEPCVLIDSFEPKTPYRVVADDCNGCSNCLNVGCPAILVTRRETEIAANGKEVEKTYVEIETGVCTGCDLCPSTCGPKAIVPAEPPALVPA